MHGRFFRVPTQGLNELPDSALLERGEYGIAPPLGVPPRAADYAPSSTPGRPPVDVSLSERQSNWQAIVFTAGTTAIKVQDFTYRKFFLIQNKSAVGTLYVGFGYEPNALNGIVLPAGVGFEPYSYPINDIWVLGTVAGMNGVLIYGT